MTDNVMTKEIAGAVVAVMASIEQLEKTGTNTFQKYKFAGIDDFLEMMRPKLAAAGLFILIDELECQVLDSKQVFYRFGFMFVHSSGNTYNAGTRTVTVTNSGAQTAGSSQSYALKQFMRATFNISTGDADEDVSDQKPMKQRPTKTPPPKQAPKDLSPEEKIKAFLGRPNLALKMMDDKTEWVKKIIDAFNACESGEVAAKLWTDNANNLSYFEEADEDTHKALVTAHDAVFIRCGDE